MNFSGRVTSTSLSEMSLNSTPAHVMLAPLSPFATETFMPMAARVCRIKPSTRFLRCRVPCKHQALSSRYVWCWPS